MRQSILWKFLTAYLIFALTGLLVINFTTTRQTFRQLIRSEANAIYNTASSMAAFISNAGGPAESDKYTQSINNFKISNGSTLWVTDIEGNVFFTSELKKVPEKINNFNISYFNDNPYNTGNFFGYFNTTRLTCYAPIQINEQVVGYVFIHRPTNAILYKSIEIVDIFYITYFVILASSFILLLVFILHCYMPIKAIRKATEEYAHGNFAYDKLKLNTNDEIGDLAASLLYMANQLNNAEEYQKKFISNISHDLRSPLTSIKGYAGAIIDGTIPPEMQNRYLGIILTEAERLEKLATGLISLNTWGDNGPGLIMEEFDLDDVIKGVINSFEGTGIKKGIRIVFDSGHSHIVKADKSKIQQVLYNLIDNAIKFSPKDSEIKILVFSKGDKIFCSVKDSGIGISSDEILKIWDRFYKTDSSRGRDKTGSGIGLSIVKEIITAHNQNIDVVSTEGVGTEFIFSLERIKKKK